MWAQSTRAAATITRSHSVRVRATAYGRTIGTLAGLPVVDGEVTVDSGSQVRRTGTVELASPSLWPYDPADILAPYGTEVLVEYGIVVSRTVTEWVPIIRGLITQATRTRGAGGSGPITLSLADRSIRVAEDRLDAPAQTVSGATTVAEITRLIQESIPTATVVDRTGSTQVAAVLEIERERWADGVEKLADSIGAEVYADPIGTFVIRPQPLLTDPVVWQVASGRGGILVERTDDLTRERVYNRVVATGERTDGTPPVRAVVSDTDTTSPTYYGGDFGKKPYFYTSPLLTSTGMATTAATTILARARGMQASVTLDAIVNPALDAGDVIRVVDEGRTTTHIVDKLTVPLGVGGVQTISTRSVDLEP
ncbi:hypothetical protein GCM10022243_48080 [Saccharothrix violaceirubra]|uniref:DUF5047 domain-containing protein n=1 Tax=Saccharothrix violaceirubra TaxID=413306 RepID=A0A7W7SZS9_9PSEU|nr:DUF5047 domain-containing protein [Saccharothrix violaceirubra]MBB4963850.1 hypothetical protein [Saccharothrix violaceirubra]